MHACARGLVARGLVARDLVARLVLPEVVEVCDLRDSF